MQTSNAKDDMSKEKALLRGVHQLGLFRKRWRGMATSQNDTWQLWRDEEEV